MAMTVDSMLLLMQWPYAKGNSQRWMMFSTDEEASGWMFRRQIDEALYCKEKKDDKKVDLFNVYS